MKSNNSNNQGGIGFVGALLLLLIGLKLAGIIGWSWWWVLSPIWISIAVLIFAGLLIVFISERGRK